MVGHGIEARFDIETWHVSTVVKRQTVVDLDGARKGSSLASQLKSACLFRSL